MLQEIKTRLSARSQQFRKFFHREFCLIENSSQGSSVKLTMLRYGGNCRWVAPLHEDVIPFLPLDFKPRALERLDAFLTRYTGELAHTVTSSIGA